MPEIKPCSLYLTSISQITLEEVEVVFGSGAGSVVKQALARRGSLTNYEGHELTGSFGDSPSPTEEYETGTLKSVPKATRRLVHIHDTAPADV